ncbi:MAG: zinc ABC transporter substrate-binding protein [Deltaproteobacteria bacterium]|nr:zinc ABC transporter substrate-binding protein [Deltaproteobacteria bacterium]
MKRTVVWILGILTIGFGMLSTSDATPASAAVLSKRILCSTFPIYQITRNVTLGRDAVSVELMLPAQLGCPHDYALTPRDMQKLSQADVLIINGLDMEEFLEAPLRKARTKLRVIDSSTGIQDVLWYAEEHDNDHMHSKKISTGEKAAGHAHDADMHQHEGINPHLFTSPKMAAKLAMNIAAELAKVDPEGAAIYAKNARQYADKLNALADDFAALGKTVRNNRIITQHGVFDYLARDMGLEISAVVQAHAGQEPSAAEMLEIIRMAKEKKVAAVFTEPQYPARVGQTIARESGILTATLDPVATGPENAPLDYFETIMRQNMVILKETLGTR